MPFRPRRTPAELKALIRPERPQRWWQGTAARLTLATVLVFALITTLRRNSGERLLPPMGPDRQMHQLLKLQKGPLQSVDAYYARAEVYREHRHFSEAIDDYTAILARNPRAYRALSLRADSQMQLQQFQAAAADWGRYLQRFSRDVSARNQRGLCFLRLKRWAEARADFSLALQQAPALPALWANRGLAWLEEGKLAEAERDLLKALYLQPDLPETHFFLGRLALKQGYPTGALKAFDQTLRLRPQYTQARVARAALHRELGHCEAARIDDRQACREGYTPACRKLPCRPAQP